MKKPKLTKQEEIAIRNKEIAAKRMRTIAAKKAAEEKRIKMKARRDKFLAFSAKPIVWIFAIFGFGSAIYFVVKGAIFAIQYLISNWL